VRVDPRQQGRARLGGSVAAQALKFETPQPEIFRTLLHKSVLRPILAPLVVQAALLATIRASPTRTSSQNTRSA
jgi:hypothetical protein